MSGYIPTRQGIYSFHGHARDGSVGETKEYLDIGVPVDAPDGNGVTALMSAAMSGQIETMKLLLDHGADPNAQNKHGHGALHMVFTNGEPFKECIKVLLDAGAKIDLQAKDGQTPLFGGLNCSVLSDLNYSHELIFLVENGASWHTQCDWGITPYMFLMEYGMKSNEEKILFSPELIGAAQSAEDHRVLSECVSSVSSSAEARKAKL